MKGGFVLWLITAAGAVWALGSGPWWAGLPFWGVMIMRWYAVMGMVQTARFRYRQPPEVLGSMWLRGMAPAFLAIALVIGVSLLLRWAS